jgi:hypothetical protein
MVHNVHERTLPVPAKALGGLLDRIGGPDDPLWPTPAWVPMVLDGPLADLPKGGHGAIRYRVTAYDPGRLVEFTFPSTSGVAGTHTFSVEALGPDRSVLRHVLDARPRGSMRLLWPLVVRFAHDAVLEDLLDRAEATLGVGPAHPARWSPWVRVIQRFGMPRVRAATVPETRLLREGLDRVDFSDAHEVTLRPGMPLDPQVWVDAVFGRAAESPLIKLRNRLVGLVGIEPGTRDTFAVVARSADEVLLGSDDSHLDFRASVLREPKRVVIGTVVKIHNLRGRAYFAIVRLVHPTVVHKILSKAALELSRSSDLPGRRSVTMDA